MPRHAQPKASISFQFYSLDQLHVSLILCFYSSIYIDLACPLKAQLCLYIHSLPFDFLIGYPLSLPELKLFPEPPFFLEHPLITLLLLALVCF